MKFFWNRSRDPDKPDPETAEEHLRRVRGRQPEVNALIEALVTERKLNNFTANVVVTFRGGRP